MKFYPGTLPPSQSLYTIVGNRSKEVLKRMQKAVLSDTLNIARTFKVVT